MRKPKSKRTGGNAYRQHTTLKNFIRERDHYTCQICGEYGDQVDHIIPYAISHDSHISNLRVLCRKCNIVTRRKRKAALPYPEWIARIENELVQFTAGLA